MERTSEAEIQGVVNVILEQLPYCADNFADDFALWLSQNKTSAKDNFDKITGPNYRDTLAEQVLRTPRGDVKLEELLGPGVLQPGSIFQFFGDDLFEVEDVVFGNRAAAFIKFAARKAQLRVGKADSQDSNLLALCLEGNVLAHPHELVAVFGNAVLRLGEEADGSAIRVLEYIFASEVLCWLGAFVERWVREEVTGGLPCDRDELHKKVDRHLKARNIANGLSRSPKACIGTANCPPP
ncbi:hypothetical protein CYMTET_34671 [Cymbomonas tetramitiformis]|uniref:Uncharacterized protein n=1 Tax=Cymbomonas tetramitiformis TaxID=36881 RepID=A0AAE0FAN7_9CHLO|nr:hypothetical protein CYMTET_34671 [Cymbomonas tetramitiformis]